MSTEYNPGKIKPLIKITANILNAEPSLHSNHDKLIKKVEEEIPELQDKSKCANCEAPMTQYVYNLNVLIVALVITMVRAVTEAILAGKSFREANMVHIPTLATTDAIRHKTTNAAKLGLIAKYLKDGRHVKGMWVITRRGFDALEGKEIPTGIIVWRGRIIERPGYLTTFAETQKTYKIKVENSIKKQRNEEVMNYNNNEWVDFAGLHDGKLF